MQYTNVLLGLSAIAVASAAAPAPVTATSSPFIVSVGKDGLSYTPSNIIAPVGTKIAFEFFPKNHTVTQSSFADPCHPLAAGGFFSGFNPTAAGAQGNTFTIEVTDDKPIWFYCSQITGNHCQSGMVGSINAKQTGANTLDAFITLAKNASVSTFPAGGVQGGILSVAGGNNSSSSASASVSSASASISASVYYSATASVGTSLPTYTAAPTTLSTPSGTFPGPTSTPSSIQVNSASGYSANLFGAAAILVGALAML